MTVYCNDQKRRDWSLGHNICDGNSAKCGQLVKIGGQEYCGYCPPRCTLYQIIKSQAGCLFCKYAPCKLNCTRCDDCLSADTRINYERDERLTREPEESK